MVDTKIITHQKTPADFVTIRGGKNGIICARARSSVYATEWGIFEIVSTKTILQTIDAQKVRPKTDF